ncbi:MAG: NUDIX domain-containing protein [Planctomycetota bacterium]
MSYIYKYPRPMVTVDVVMLGIDESELQVLLVKRGREPFRDMWALPGGFVDTHETLEEAATRELFEETGLTAHNLYPHRPYSDPERDPRGRNISFAYLSLMLREEKDVVAGDDASEVRWFSIDKLPSTAFDHDQIIHDGIIRLRELAFTSDILLSLLPQPFPEGMLTSAISIVMDGPVDAAKTIAHFTDTGLISQVGTFELNGRDVPLYRLTPQE